MTDSVVRRSRDLALLRGGMVERVKSRPCGKSGLPSWNTNTRACDQAAAPVSAPASFNMLQHVTEGNASSTVIKQKQKHYSSNSRESSEEDLYGIIFLSQQCRNRLWGVTQQPNGADLSPSYEHTAALSPERNRTATWHFQEMEEMSLSLWSMTPCWPEAGYLPVNANKNSRYSSLPFPTDPRHFKRFCKLFP